MVFVSSRLTDHEALRVSNVSLAWRPSAERYKVGLLCRYKRKVGSNQHQKSHIMYTWIACFVVAFGISNRPLKAQAHFIIIPHNTLRETSVGKWIYWNISHPWHYRGANTVTDQWVMSSRLGSDTSSSTSLLPRQCPRDLQHKFPMFIIYNVVFNSAFMYINLL